MPFHKKIVRKLAGCLRQKEGTKSPWAWPDLIVVVVEDDRSRVTVVDVAVPYENGDSLSLARQTKLDKYAAIVPVLKARFGVQTGRVEAVVIGARGAVPPETKSLGLRAGLATALSMSALRSSIEMFAYFMDGFQRRLVL